MPRHSSANGCNDHSRLLLWALAALFVGLLAAPSVSSAAVTRPECSYSCGGVTEDGRSAIFTFQSALSEDAVDGQIYLRTNGVTRSIVHNADGSPAEQYAELLGFSNNGQRIFFQSIEQLVPADQDGNFGAGELATPDIYEWNEGRISLVSTGPGEVNNRFALFNWGGMSADGRHAYFTTRVSLVPEDTDICDDVYERFNGHTEFVSTGPAASPGFEGAYCDVAQYGGESADGSHVFFTSYDHLVPEDTDMELDVYQRVNGQTSLVSDFDEGSLGNCSVYAGFAAATADGTTVLLSTNQTLSPADTDADFDAYVRNPDGSYELISVNTPSPFEGCGSGDTFVSADRLSADGSRALFRTNMRLVPGDRDDAIDLYERDRRTDETELISTGPADPQSGPRTSFDYIRSAYFDASDDLRRVAFETALTMVDADSDSEPDVYERVGGITRLASVGPDGKSSADIAAKLISVSNDGAGIVFSTREQLVPLDTDRAVDFYVRATETVSVPGSGAAKPSLRRRRRTRMLSIESIAPRMKVAQRGAFNRGAARIRLSCPAVETSGPCRGRIRLTVGRRRVGLGRASFKIASGRSETVRVALNQRGQRLAARRKPVRVRARLRAADRVGNTRRSRHVVVIGHRSR